MRFLLKFKSIEEMSSHACYFIDKRFLRGKNTMNSLFPFPIVLQIFCLILSRAISEEVPGYILQHIPSHIGFPVMSNLLSEVLI